MSKTKFISFFAIVISLLDSGALNGDEAIATYIGNEGVIITHGETSIAFDPVFNRGYGLYDLETALFKGDPPFNKLDAVFVSHIHGDHFDAAIMTELLQQREDLLLFASEQVVQSMITLLPPPTMMKRVTSIKLDYGDTPVSMNIGDMEIGASRIPHAGWPDRQTDIENLAFRVTIGNTTVLHLGDADTKRIHYSPHADFWAGKGINLALPPYWYFSSTNGLDVLAEVLKPDMAVGVHVPTAVPDDRSQWDEAYEGFDLFVRPGESRRIPHEHHVLSPTPTSSLQGRRVAKSDEGQ